MKLGWQLIGCLVLGFWIGMGLVTIDLFLEAHEEDGRVTVNINLFGEAQVEYIVIIGFIVLSIIFAAYCFWDEWKKGGQIRRRDLAWR